MKNAIRVVIALSGGVDSAVTALFLSHCVHTSHDIAALQAESTAPPPLATVLDAIHTSTPWSVVAKAKSSQQIDFPVPVAYRSVHMRNWNDQDSNWCQTSVGEFNDAQDVAHSLGLLPTERRLTVLDFSAEYAERCFQPMLQSYQKGRTLNVDVLCNSEIKFGALLERVRRPPYSADYIATGHYARVVRRHGLAQLASPFSALKDLNDQTVFLSRVPSFAAALFPLGHLFHSKEEVRRAAAECGGPVLQRLASKKTSTGLCFVGKVREKGAAVSTCSAVSATPTFATFLSEYIAPPSTVGAKRCRFFMLERDEEIKRQHLKWGRSSDGAERELFEKDYGVGCIPSFALTVGQRVVWEEVIGKKRRVHTCYVAKKVPHDDEEVGEVALLKEVYLAPTWNHPSFYTTTIAVTSVHLHVPIGALDVKEHDQYKTLSCYCVCRHQDARVPCELQWRVSAETSGREIEKATVLVQVPLRAVAPGQLAVLYASADLVSSVVWGSGWIA
ncbi:tRNA-specific 2-thiouridylase [Angomonas deanei]|uniref:tRNA-5-taurinomethyluridine 2-sulfurtransferase n=1 Tax=Angomonas deanei TaxID=59799 RepID=A0A7G2CS25_9TRYP|nr:tRNA-specific 2-thiouridylase [Angomonas deanei]CAD2222169.1 tRNA methyl transferase, putative [Angomonas deanei]|eukprot:EPY26089.1 tRNA-specific 2-thiouridylase [Angomonas deanei]